MERYLAIDTKAIKLHMLIKIQLLDAYSKDIIKKEKSCADETLYQNRWKLKKQNTVMNRSSNNV